MKKLRKQIISFLLAITLVLSLTNVIAPIMSKAADPIVLEDGVYEFKAVKEGDDILYPVDSAYSMFKVWYAKLTVSDGNMTADIAMTSSSFKLFMGDVDAATEANNNNSEDIINYEVDAEFAPQDVRDLAAGKDKELKYVFKNIPVAALDTPVLMTSIGSNGSKIKDSSLTFSSEKILKDGAPVDFNNQDKEDKNNEKDNNKEDNKTVIADGKYTIEVDTGADMFKVVYAEIEVKNGKMVADIALSGQGYDYLHMGTGSDVTEAGKIGYTVKKVPVDGKMVEKYVYSGIPVSALDEAIAITSHSEARDKWYDRTLTFKSNTLKKIAALPLTVTAKDEVKTTISASELANADGAVANIALKTGTVSFDEAALKAFIASAVGDVTLEMKDVSSSDNYKNAGYDMVISLSLVDSTGKALFKEGTNGEATITVPYTKEVETGKTVNVYYITATGKEAVDATYDATNKTVTFTLKHFSDYAITQEIVKSATSEDTAKDEAKVSPKTGDTNQVAFYLVLLATCAGTMLIRKKISIKE